MKAGLILLYFFLSEECALVILKANSLSWKNRDRGGLFSPDGGEESPWATPSTPATPSSPPTPTEAEGDGLSYNQRSLQRWEKDEELGELSTISPVLYANTNFPNLKQDYPGKRG